MCLLTVRFRPALRENHLVALDANQAGPARVIGAVQQLWASKIKGGRQALVRHSKVNAGVRPRLGSWRPWLRSMGSDLATRPRMAGLARPVAVHSAAARIPTRPMSSFYDRSMTVG